MTATFWAWFLGLYAAFTTGLFLVVAIGSHEIIEALRRKLDIAETVTDTLAFDLADALRIGSDTPVHDAVVVDLFAKQLEQPSRDWPL